VIDSLVTVGEDSAGVRRPVGSINGNGKGHYVTHGFKLRFTSEPGSSGNSERVHGARGLSTGWVRSVSGDIRVRSFSTDTVIGIIEHSFVFPSSETSRVSLVDITRNELLFGHSSEGSDFHEFGRFTSSGGGESPARSTRSLVFNSRDGTSIDPVGVSDEGGG